MIANNQKNTLKPNAFQFLENNHDLIVSAVSLTIAAVALYALSQSNFSSFVDQKIVTKVTSSSSPSIELKPVSFNDYEKYFTTCPLGGESMCSLESPFFEKAKEIPPPKIVFTFKNSTVLPENGSNSLVKAVSSKPFEVFRKELNQILCQGFAFLFIVGFPLFKVRVAPPSRFF